ncbi:MAG: diphthine synthase [Candidatus Woesearchaeota archaeon]
MLYLIGAGLKDEYDLSLRAIEVLKNCDEIFFEKYTSYSQISIKNLEKIINKPIISVGRSFIEEKSNEIINQSKEKNIAIIVIGHPLIATTHSIFLSCDHIEILHNYSVLNYISVTGLDMYKFGRIVSIPFHESYSFIDHIKKNLSINLHTLILLDLDVEKERFMIINEALERLVEFKEHFFIACCGLAQSNEKILFSTYRKLQSINFENYPKPQCLILPANLQFFEEEILKKYLV